MEINTIQFASIFQNDAVSFWQKFTKESTFESQLERVRRSNGLPAKADFFPRPLLSHTENCCITDATRLRRCEDGRREFQLPFSMLRCISRLWFYRPRQMWRWAPFGGQHSRSRTGRSNDLLAAGVIAPPLQTQNGRCRLSFNSPPAQSEESWFQRSSSWNLSIWTPVSWCLLKDRLKPADRKERLG